MADQETNKTIIDYKNDYYFYSGESSKINRNLAFAGIAIIWIFRETENGVNIIPDPLSWPLIGLVMVLALDLLHYVLGGLLWFIFYKRQEKKIIKKEAKIDDTIEATDSIPNTLHFLYWAKIIVNFFTFVFLLRFLYYKLIAI